MLLIVAAEVVGQSAQCHAAVSLEHRRALQLRLVESAQQRHGVHARFAELREHALRVGVRVIALQDKLNQRVAELQAALANVKQLHGLLPICSYCKRIRGDDQYWLQVEAYIADHSDAQFSHGICPTCYVEMEKQIESYAKGRRAPDGSEDANDV